MRRSIADMWSRSERILSSGDIYRGPIPPAGGGRALVGAAGAALQRFADRVLQVRIALEAQLLAELDHARLADAQRAGQLRRGVVAQQVRVVEQEVGDAALDRRHVVALGADFEQRRHLSRSYPACGRRVRVRLLAKSRPSPGAARLPLPQAGEGL